jgi:hypothetical protein
MNLVAFKSWPEVLAYARTGGPLYYQAPMDQRPTMLRPGSGTPYSYEAKARSIRIWPPGSTGRGRSRTADPFTADAGHLERFSRPDEGAASGGEMHERGKGRRVRSRHQPSLPGFPDIPGKLEIQIPDMPMWEQIDGDMDPGAHGGTIAKSDGRALELFKIQPVREYVGDTEAAEAGFPFWTREAYYDLDDLTNKENISNVMSFIGMDHNQLEDLTPTQRALTIASALMDYGTGVDEGPSGWSGDLPDHEVKWSSGATATLREYLADEDESFKDDVLGYSDIRSNLEKKVEEMADIGAAQTWSTIGDQHADDAARDGFDSDSLVGVASFGDAVAVNGDLESERTESGVEADLEKDGYELTDLGGRVPTTEEHVSPDSAIRAVAHDMELPIETVKEAAQGIDWWPKDRNDEIASSTSGYASIWGKKDSNAHVDDGDYVVQGAYSDGTIVGGLGGGGGETFSLNDEQAAIRAAQKLLRDPTFEGDYVTVITRDGELVWSSRPEDGMQERRSPRRRR